MFPNAFNHLEFTNLCSDPVHCTVDLDEELAKAMSKH